MGRPYEWGVEVSATLAAAILVAVFLCVSDAIWASDRTRDQRTAWKVAATTLLIVGCVALWRITEPTTPETATKETTLNDISIVANLPRSDTAIFPMMFEIHNNYQPLRSVDLLCRYERIDYEGGNLVDDTITARDYVELVPTGTTRRRCKPYWTWVEPIFQPMVLNAVVSLEITFSIPGSTGRYFVKKRFRLNRDDFKRLRWDAIASESGSITP